MSASNFVAILCIAGAVIHLSFAGDPRKRPVHNASFLPAQTRESQVKADVNRVEAATSPLERKRLLSQDPCRKASCGAGRTCMADAQNIHAFSCKSVNGNDAAQSRKASRRT